MTEVVIKTLVFLVTTTADSLISNDTQNKSQGADIILTDAGYNFIAFMLTTCFIFGSFINGLCLFVFMKNKRLRSPTNIFVMSLNICDMLMSLIGE